MTLAVLALAAAGVCAQAPQSEPSPNPVVVLQTEKGAIEIEVDSRRAPITAGNFLKYVDGGFYDGGSINRAVRPDNTVRRDVEIQVIQFQSDPARRREQFAAIPLERTSATGLKHVDGTLSMGRGGPDTATASFPSSSAISRRWTSADGGTRMARDSPRSGAWSAVWMSSRPFRRPRLASEEPMEPSRSNRRSRS